MSDANTWATDWAERSDVVAGDWRLATYRNEWYIIEKYDSLSPKYLVTEKVIDSEVETVMRIWEAQYGRSFKEELSRDFSSNDDNYRQAVEYGEERSSIYDDDVKYSREDKEVFRLGESEDGKQQDKFNSDESAVSSNKDRQGNGSSGLSYSDRFDTDYLSAVERGDMKTAQKMVDEAAGYSGIDITVTGSLLNDDYGI